MFNKKSNNYYKKPLKIKDFLIINLPAWVFLLFGISIAIFSFQGPFNQSRIISIILIIFSWQAICCVIMLLVSYQRRKRIFLRILKVSKSKDKLTCFLRPIKLTPCGMAIWFAAKSRFSTRFLYFN